MRWPMIVLPQFWATCTRPVKTGIAIIAAARITSCVRSPEGIAPSISCLISSGGIRLSAAETKTSAKVKRISPR